MKNLEAFTSKDAIGGRIWTDGDSRYRRNGDQLERLHVAYNGDNSWIQMATQVAAMPGDVRWQDEVSLAIALRALADGDTLNGQRGFKIRLNGEKLERFDGESWSETCGSTIFDLAPWAIDMEASVSGKWYTGLETPTDRMAEVEPPPMKTPDIKPEPEFHLSYEDARRAAWAGDCVASELYPSTACRIHMGIDQLFDIEDHRWEDADGGEFGIEEEKDAGWRIVPNPENKKEPADEPIRMHGLSFEEAMGAIRRGYAGYMEWRPMVKYLIRHGACFTEGPGFTTNEWSFRADDHKATWGIETIPMQGGGEMSAFRTRKDLRAAPFNWRLPKPVRVEVVLKQAGKAKK